MLGFRDFHCVSVNTDELPAWTEQLASLKRYILDHEDRAPGSFKAS
jgi:hypothetical protein